MKTLALFSRSLKQIKVRENEEEQEKKIIASKGSRGTKVNVSNVHSQWGRGLLLASSVRRPGL